MAGEPFVDRLKVYTKLSSLLRKDQPLGCPERGGASSGAVLRGCLKSRDSVIFHRLRFPIPASKQLGRTLFRVPRVLICQDFSNILLGGQLTRQGLRP